MKTVRLQSISQKGKMFKKGTKIVPKIRKRCRGHQAQRWEDDESEKHNIQ